MNEADLLRDIRLLSHGDVRLFRNNSGMYQDPRGNFVHYGLCVGSSDLIGWRTITIRPEHVGTERAIFCAIEVKGDRGLVTAPQRRFIDVVRTSGGLAGVAYSLSDARHILALDNLLT